MKPFTTVLLLLVPMLHSSRTLLAQTIQLLPQATIDTPQVSLGQVARITSPVSGEADKLAGLVLQPAPPVGARVALALSAETRGDVPSALAHYRAAVSSDPRCVDRRSPGFLGEAFEGKLRRWLSGLKSGRIAAGPAALSDASFIFRRMYGGCG